MGMAVLGGSKDIGFVCVSGGGGGNNVSLLRAADAARTARPASNDAGFPAVDD